MIRSLSECFIDGILERTDKAIDRMEKEYGLKIQEKPTHKQKPPTKTRRRRPVDRKPKVND